MKNFVRKIIRKLYWKLGCNQQEEWAKRLIIHCVPGRLAAKEVTLILTQLNENLQLELVAWKPPQIKMPIIVDHRFRLP